MTVERYPVQPGELHPMRVQAITGSVIGALVGAHPRRTPAGLFYEKSQGLAPDAETTDDMLRGQIGEPSVAKALALHRRDWTIRPAGEFLLDPDLKLGATPDAYFQSSTVRLGVLEYKTCARFVFEKWDGMAPTHYVLQTAVGGMLADADVSYLVVLILGQYGFDPVPHLFEVPRVPAAEQRIRDLVKEFWANVAANTPPKIDYSRDGDLIALLYPQEVAGKTVDLRHDNRLPALLAERRELIAVAKDAEGRREIIDNEIKEKIGDAEIALIAGWRATYKQQTRKATVLQEKRFRVLRVKEEST